MKKKEVIAEGKTKVVRVVDGNPNLVIIESKDDITKNDNPGETQQLPSKAKYSTTTTSVVFDLLKKAGIPVAYQRQISETEFLAVRCKMIQLEVVIRRYAVGSYLKRYPNLRRQGKVPHRFHKLVFELFLKTTGGNIVDNDGHICGTTPIDPATERHIDDPFISNPNETIWDLKHPKIPGWEGKADLHCPVVMNNVLPKGVTVRDIEEIARKVFLVIEGAWSRIGLREIDFKIEFGIGPRGELLVADVIDNDSWRLRTRDWEELSKQLFRDNAAMGDIADKYALVAHLVTKFSIPNQAVIFWRGSPDDKLPEFPEIAGVDFDNIIKSGHKSPSACLSQLEDTLALYPEGGVILALVGMSNGLGPVLAARTSWPVIGVALTADAHPEDAWSSLRLPSNVPMMTIVSPKNAVLAALNILAQNNPVAYMHRQYAIEQLDI